MQTWKTKSSYFNKNTSNVFIHGQPILLENTTQNMQSSKLHFGIQITATTLRMRSQNLKTNVI